MAKEPSSAGKKRFHNHVEKALAKGHPLLIHYKKLNGRTVKRKIEPRSWRGNTLVAYDHKRKAVRSFRMERVKHMEKAATAADDLMNGFTNGAGIGALLGALAAGGIQARYSSKGIPEAAMFGALAAMGPGALIGAPVNGLYQAMKRKSMEKKAFWAGFEKQAGWWRDANERAEKGMQLHTALQVNKLQHQANAASIEKLRPKAPSLGGGPKPPGPPPPPAGGLLKQAAFWDGFEKTAAGSLRESASLGLLAGPSAYHLATGKDMNPTVAHTSEVIGLGALAKPYVGNLYRAGKEGLASGGVRGALKAIRHA